MTRLNAILGVLLALSACSGGSKQANSVIYPTGVATDAVALHDTKGIYVGDTLCCWLSGDARFVIPATSDAKQIVLETYEPTSGPLAASQSITLVSEGQRASHPVHAGRDTVSLPIPKGMVANGTASVHLIMGKSVVPRDAGLNGDVRRLSIVLESATAR